MKSYLKKAVIFVFACAVLTFGAGPAFGTEGEGDGDDQYSFKVHNSTKHTIKQLLASEDGKKYGNFDVGKGIAPGKTVTMVWDKSTNGDSCKQYFKAVFDDGEESEAELFDFCEEDLTLEF